MPGARECADGEGEGSGAQVRQDARAQPRRAAAAGGDAAQHAEPRQRRQPQGGADAARRPSRRAKRAAAPDALTRVTHETEVRGTETRVERVVERAPKPSLPDVDRASAGRGRYVYCIIRANAAAQVRRHRHGRAVGRRLHHQLQGHGGGRLRRADRAARLHARERARARARQRDGDARSHGHPDVVRHHLQDPRGHPRAAALGLRRVCRRAEQDAGQARVRPQGAVGPRRDRPGDRAGGRGHPPAEDGDLVAEGVDLFRAHAVRPADRRARCSSGRSATSPSSCSGCATSRWPRASTARSATR